MPSKIGTCSAAISLRNVNKNKRDRFIKSIMPQKYATCPNDGHVKTAALVALLVA